MIQSLLRKTIIDKLAVDFEIINTFIAICSHFQTISYVDDLELQVLAKEMVNIEIPTLYQLKTLEKFGRTKYKLHQ